MKKLLAIVMFLSAALVYANGGKEKEADSAKAAPGSTNRPASVTAAEDSAVFEGDGLSLAEAIEQSAEKIAADLPAGSRVAIVAWESPSLGLSDYIMEELTGALVDRGMEVADRQNLEYVYRELKLQMSGEVSDESARSIGKFLGAGLVITGQFTELGGPYRYRASAIHVENATRDSVTRIDVKGDAALRRMVAALASQKTAVKTASYGENVKTAPQTEESADNGKPAPKTAGAFLDRGIIFASRGDYEMAIEEFTEAIKLDPELATAYRIRGQAYFAGASDVVSVGENFSKVITNSTGGTISPAQRQAFDKAIADYTQAIKLESDNADAYRLRGWVYSNKGDYDQAMTDYKQALRLNPDDAWAYNNRGIAYDAKGDSDKAIADYTQAIKLDPNFPSPYHNRGGQYFNKKDYDRAIADYAQAIRIDPDYAPSKKMLPIAYNSRGVDYANKEDYDRAIADYTQAINLEPSASRYNSRGNAYYNKKDYDRAIADYEAALRNDPNHANAKTWLAYAYYNRGLAYYNNNKDYDRAIADYTQAIRLKSDYVDAYNNRGVAYANKKDYDKAIEDYTQAIRLNPDFARAKNNLVSAYHNRGLAYYNQKDYDRAIADYTQAIRLDPDDAVAYYNRGNAYYVKKDYNRAITDYEAALRNDPNHDNARTWLAYARRARGW
jgi:tetratricopeptide (TPR) repeat protein